MKIVRAMIRVERVPVLKEKLKKLGIHGFATWSVLGWSKTIERHLQWRGLPAYQELIPATSVEIVIHDDQYDSVVKTIIESARTGEHGEPGDGMIFTFNIENAISIATLEKDEKSF